MSDPTYIACPRCGERLAMSLMQKRLFYGRTLSCQRCAKPFSITEETPDPQPLAAFVPPMQSTGDSPVAAASPSRDGLTPRQVIVVIVAVALLLAGTLYWVVAPSVHRSRERARQASCGNNLLQIGAALQAYAATNNGQFPDSLQRAVTTGDLYSELLVCPSTDAPEDGSQPSYIYVGKDLTVTSPNQVMAYESLNNHAGAGVNVLFLDGTVQFMMPAAAIQAIPQLAGPTTTTTSRPSSP